MRQLLLRHLLGLATIMLASGSADGLQMYGCALEPRLCDSDEICYADGLFGQCHTPESAVAEPQRLAPLDEDRLSVLRGQLDRLVSSGLDWADAETQCTLAYYKLTVSYGLDYDLDFCRPPRNALDLWAMLQLVDTGIQDEEERRRALEPLGILNTDSNLVVLPIDTDDELPEALATEQDNNNNDEDDDDDDNDDDDEEVVVGPVILSNDVEDADDDAEEDEENENEPPEVIVAVPEAPLLVPVVSEEPDEDDRVILENVGNDDDDDDDDEEQQENGGEGFDEAVKTALQDVGEGRQVDYSTLNDAQLAQLIGALYAMNAFEKVAAVAQNPESQGQQVALATPPGEIEEAPTALPTGQEEQRLVLKKDIERIGDVDMGLDPKRHKIVKGRTVVSPIKGDRIYVKVALKDDEQLLPLVDFLENTIAQPNKLWFDDFQFDRQKGQLSMRILRRVELPENGDDDDDSQPQKRDVSAKKGDKIEEIESPEQLAKTVYKRRKDILKVSAADVLETGIGEGDDTVPVESRERDWLVQPLVLICATTVLALGSVLAAQVVRSRRRRQPLFGAGLDPEIGGGKNGHAYQELCRERMTTEGGCRSPPGVWSMTTEEAGTSAGQQQQPQPQLDISTGHVILEFLQEHVADPQRVDSQWSGVEGYHNQFKTTTRAAEKMPDVEQHLLPYDDNLVRVGADASEFLDASLIYDNDPKQAAYIVAALPAGQDNVNKLWTLVWEQGVTLLATLAPTDECREKAAVFWPEAGSVQHGHFEIHLVSEHIWSEDYLVRSFYLKNLQTAQTRTITQFHYLSWRQSRAPGSVKSLLEFRRKVQRSYRARGSPLLVVSGAGRGRAGTFLLLDMQIARLLRGVKEVDMVAGVEWLRDQRAQLVENVHQFRFAFAALANEVNTLLGVVGKQ